MSADSARERLEEAVKDSDSSPQSALSAKGGLDVILRDQNSMLELATYLQRGLHSGLDIISDPDVVLYDSLLTSFLHDRNINLPHRLLHLHKGSKWDSTILYIDTLVNIGTPGYVPTSKAVNIIILSTSIQIKATVSSWNRPACWSCDRCRAFSPHHSLF